MAGFLIPLAGLALGALGRLINQRRSSQALGNATAVAGANTPSETGLSTAASSPLTVNVATQQGTHGSIGAQNPTTSTGTGTQSNKIANPLFSGNQTPEVGGSKSAFREFAAARRGPRQTKTTMATAATAGPGTPGFVGPLQAGESGGLSAAEIGQQSITRSRRRNREQQARVSNAALS